MHKVFWSNPEKEKIVSLACDIQSERPDLSGLPLLREALRALPVNRRRKLVAVTQAPWFELSMTAELKRRAAERRTDDPLLGVVMTNSKYLEDNDHRMQAWREENRAWQTNMLAQNAQLIVNASAMLKLSDILISISGQFLAEIRALNAKIESLSPAAKRPDEGKQTLAIPSPNGGSRKRGAAR